MITCAEVKDLCRCSFAEVRLPVKYTLRPDESDSVKKRVSPVRFARNFRNGSRILKSMTLSFQQALVIFFSKN